MQQRTFGQLGDISALTLGGGGIGQVWGPTTREEAIATVRAAWEAGITFFDVAPSYGRGEAEVVLGEAFGGRLPEGVRVSTKCAVGNRSDARARGRQCDFRPGAYALAESTAGPRLGRNHAGGQGASLGATAAARA